QPGEYLTAGSLSGLPLPGQPLRVFVPRDSWLAQTGYYFALGTMVGDAEDDRNLVRFYWNVRATGSAALVRALTRTLNRYAIPFKYKCQVHAPAYSRIDGSVLFITRRHYHIAADALRGVYDAVVPHLDDDVPLFTLPLAPGLSVAEDPGTGE